MIENGGMITNVKEIVATDNAFAAMKFDGTVSAWGNPKFGGDSSYVQNQLRNVVQIIGNEHAFAARKSDGSVVTWGNYDYGGNSSYYFICNPIEVEYYPDFLRIETGRFSNHPLTDIVEIVSKEDFFAAKQSDGKVCVWGEIPTYIPKFHTQTL